MKLMAQTNYLSQLNITFPSPCGELVMKLPLGSGTVLDYLLTMFPSPCGELVMKPGDSNATATNSATSGVSVPLRGISDETKLLSKQPVKPRYCKVSVPLRGISDETMKKVREVSPASMPSFRPLAGN